MIAEATTTDWGNVIITCVTIAAGVAYVWIILRKTL